MIVGMSTRNNEVPIGDRYGRKDWSYRYPNQESLRYEISRLNVHLGQAIESGTWDSEGEVGKFEQFTQLATFGGQPVLRTISVLSPRMRVENSGGLRKHVLDVDGPGSLTQFRVGKDVDQDLVILDLSPNKTQKEAIRGVALFDSVARVIARGKNSGNPEIDEISLDLSVQNLIVSRMKLNPHQYEKVLGRGDVVLPHLSKVEFVADHQKDGSGKIREVEVQVDWWDGSQAMVLVAKRNGSGKFEYFKREYISDQDGLLETEIPGHVNKKERFVDHHLQAKDLINPRGWGDKVDFTVTDGEDETGGVDFNFRFKDVASDKIINNSFGSVLYAINSLDVMDRASDYIRP